MINREKVIKGLEICIPLDEGEKCPTECPYYQDVCYGYNQVMRDALALLKEREIVSWISVKDRLPAETHSIFYRFFGTKIWRNSMWREQSDKVLVTVVFKDGTKIVTAGETHDGIWNTTISRTLEPVVSHWMPLPEPPKTEK